MDAVGSMSGIPAMKGGGGGIKVSMRQQRLQLKTKKATSKKPATDKTPNRAWIETRIDTRDTAPRAKTRLGGFI